MMPFGVPQISSAVQVPYYRRRDPIRDQNFDNLPNVPVMRVAGLGFRVCRQWQLDFCTNAVM